MLTLADLKPRIVEVEVIMGKLPPLTEGGLPIDDVRTIPLRVPSWVEWNEMGMEIPQPEPEDVPVFKNGKKVYEKESGAAFQEKVTIANNKRMMRRLAFALIEGGNFPELKDSTPEEQITLIGGMDAGILGALSRVLNNLVQMTTARISDSAARFRSESVSRNGNADLLPELVASGEVEETTD